jgi:ferritin
MLSKKVQTALNDQINAELYSAYLYLAMSNYFVHANLSGMANWMKLQAGEEQMHAMKIYDFVQERNGEVVLAKIDEPQAKWSSPLAAFEDAYKHEQKVSGMINDIATLAMAEKDHATNVFLNWFIEEQVEEEASALEVVDQLKLVKDSPGALFMLDRELGQRTAAPASEAE